MGLLITPALLGFLQAAHFAGYCRQGAVNAAVFNSEVITPMENILDIRVQHRLIAAENNKIRRQWF